MSIPPAYFPVALYGLASVHSEMSEMSEMISLFGLPQRYRWWPGESADSEHALMSSGCLPGRAGRGQLTYPVPLALDALKPRMLAVSLGLGRKAMNFMDLTELLSQDQQLPPPGSYPLEKRST